MQCAASYKRCRETLNGSLNRVKERCRHTIEHVKRFNTEGAAEQIKGGRRNLRPYHFNTTRAGRGQPRTRTSLKLTRTRPPACGRPKLNCGRKREKSIT